MNKLIPVMAGVVSLLAASIAVADAPADPDMPQVTGSHWVQSTDELREAYLFGIGNLLEMEQAMHDDAVSSRNSMVPVLIKALSPLGLTQVKDLLNDWFAAHPEQADRPVLEVLYVEIALPRL